MGVGPITVVTGYASDAVEAVLAGHYAGQPVRAQFNPFFQVADNLGSCWIAREAFQGVDHLETGMQFQADTGAGPRLFTITKIEGDAVTVDGNHPLAGDVLNFAIEVTAVRAASEEELEHGHVHGEGGHHH